MPFTPELIDFGSLRTKLLAEYPESFGGLINNGDNSLTIFETTPSNEMHNFVANRFAQGVQRNQLSESAVPEVTFAESAWTLSELLALKSQIMADRLELEGRGVSVETVGVRDTDNTLIVGVKADLERSEQVLTAMYGAEHLEVMLWNLDTEADRYSDTPPWNGGDLIISEVFSNIFEVCTTGFGVHNATDHLLPRQDTVERTSGGTRIPLYRYGTTRP